MLVAEPPFVVFRWILYNSERHRNILQRVERNPHVAHSPRTIGCGWSPDLTTWPNIGPAAEGASPGRSSQSWAILIKRVYEVDPLSCPECVSQMAVVAFIEPPQRDVIEEILRGHQSGADHRRPSGVIRKKPVATSFSA